MPLPHPSTPVGTPVPVSAARSVPQAWRAAVHPFCLTTVTGG